MWRSSPNCRRGYFEKASLKMGLPPCPQYSSPDSGPSSTSQGRASCHQMLNNITHRSLALANIPSRLEPSGLYRADGKRPDSATMVPWSQGKFLVWDTFCDSNRTASAKERGGAAAYAESEKAMNKPTRSSRLLWRLVALLGQSPCASVESSVGG